MVGGGVVEVDRAFDQSEPEHTCVEIHALLRIARDRRHVVNAGRNQGHSSSCKSAGRSAGRSAASRWTMSGGSVSSLFVTPPRLVRARARVSAFAAITALVLPRAHPVRIGRIGCPGSSVIGVLDRGLVVAVHVFLRIPACHTLSPVWK